MIFLCIFIKPFTVGVLKLVESINKLVNKILKSKFQNFIQWRYILGRVRFKKSIFLGKFSIFLMKINMHYHRKKSAPFT